ncbi:hypothetical protein [Polaromonas eurypsychrophila]|uniref:Bacterial Ig-like domain-containing protein n=1 Tax=Polaromonas eurypsychrophila TaxID=1614635 RepID=A0A916WLW1_9BURK|nr:hypothetical protein [Polaromonas eurypsychrophila]GGB10554.1 hypothetical protein GCM10011496_34370 [Polaromonas eurypsychrophila]
MKKLIRNQLAAFFLLLPVASVMLAVPGSSYAQSATPELQSLQVGADDGLSAGSQLDFTVEGTPRGQASLTVRGIPRTIVLKETSRGVYEGSYTVRRKDRIAENSPIRATLRVRNRSTAANYSFPAGIAIASAPAAPTAPPAPVAAVGLKIDRFSVAPVDKIEPGADLRFTLNGAPGGVAEVNIQGVINNLALRETRPGVYEGAYTIRRLDNLSPSLPVVATLRLGDRAVSSTLTQPLIADAKPPVIRNMAPRDGESLARGAFTSVSGTFDDAGGVGVDPKSVRFMLSGRNVTAETQITPQFFTYRADLAPGRYTADVTAKDMVGNGVRQTWTFDVVAAAAAAPTTVPLQITSHANNATVEGGPVVVRGRTAPGALVDVKVGAVGAIAGLFGLNQNVFAQRVQADAGGNFSFSFAPQFPIPTTRYEVSMTSSKDGMTPTESRLVLFQK